MPFLRSVLLLGLPLASLCLADAAHEPERAGRADLDALKERFTALPDTSIDAVLHKALDQYRDGVFEDVQEALEQVHNDNPTLATKLIEQAAQDLGDKHDLKRRQSSGNGTALTPPNTSSSTGHTSSSPTSPPGQSTSSSVTTPPHTSSQGERTSSTSSAIVPSTPPNTPDHTSTSTTPVVPATSTSTSSEGTPPTSTTTTTSVPIISSPSIGPTTTTHSVIGGDTSVTTSTVTSLPPGSSSPFIGGHSTSNPTTSPTTPPTTQPTTPTTPQTTLQTTPTPTPTPTTKTGVIVPTSKTTTEPNGQTSVVQTSDFETSAPTSAVESITTTNGNGQQITTQTTVPAEVHTTTNAAGQTVTTTSALSAVSVTNGGGIVHSGDAYTTTDRFGNPVVVSGITGAVVTTTDDKGFSVTLTIDPGHVSEIVFHTTKGAHGNDKTITSYAVVGGATTKDVKAPGATQTPSLASSGLAPAPTGRWVGEMAAAVGGVVGFVALF